jgi:soluble lytic murein transglycosylase-like protein
MALTGKKIRTSGIIVSRPVSFTFLLIYFLQAVCIVWLIYQYIENQKLITDQKEKIEELEQKVKILDIIEEYQIGFTDQEVVTLANVIFDESTRFGIDPLLILAVIIAESSFKKHQVSEMGAEGLMQLMPSTAHAVAAKWGIEWPQKEGLRNPGLNVRVGAAYLFELILKFKDIKRAITAYNIGEAVTKEYMYFGATPPARYYNKVKKIYQELRRRFEEK